MEISLNIFVDVEQPCGMGSFGWYVGCVDIQYDDYYLHDDGVIYDTCAPRINGQGDEISTGWFKTEVEAYIQIRRYYNKHGMKPPWVNKINGDDGTDKAESQVMEFT